MRVYVSRCKGFHNDYDYLARVLRQNQGLNQVETMEDAEIYLVLAGMYLTYGYKQQIEAEIDTARQSGKKVYVIAPFGSSYIPKYFQNLNLKWANLNESDILTLIGEKN